MTRLLFGLILTNSLFGWLVADGWCWFVLREEYCWLVAGGWFDVREKYCWLVADKPSEQGENWGTSARSLETLARSGPTVAWSTAAADQLVGRCLSPTEHST
jgi:hypothetical protein